MAEFASMYATVDYEYSVTYLSVQRCVSLSLSVCPSVCVRPQSLCLSVCMRPQSLCLSVSLSVFRKALLFLIFIYNSLFVKRHLLFAFVYFLM